MKLHSIPAVALGTLLLASFASAQQVGHQKSETHPSMQMADCTKSGCTMQQTKIVLDANWRWVHKIDNYEPNCYDGNQWDTSVCPDPTTCAENCAVDGADPYASTYGIIADGRGGVQVNYVTKEGGGISNVGSRFYLLGESGDSYKLFKLKNREFAFDVDASQLPCGVNGAVYFVSMDADGGASKYPTDKAGAAYGTGYCDAQCPRDLKFINGEANLLDWQPTSPSSGTGKYGSCCTELDIWESNSISQAYTLHPCNVTGQYRCEGVACGDGADRDNGVCDKDGCDLATFRLGNKAFYGPGSGFTVDSSQPVTVVTQFITDDNTPTGNLVEVRRLYKQNGKVIHSPTFTIGNKTYSSIDDNFCRAAKAEFGDPNVYQKLGGLKRMDEALTNGMALVMSLWDDYAAHMLWLDSNYPPTKPIDAPGVLRGTCANTTGNPPETEKDYPNAYVKYSNIKIGDIGTTF